MGGILFVPEDWPAMIAGLHSWIAGELPTPWIAVWGEQNAPAPPKPYAWITFPVPPVHDGQGDRSPALRLPGTGVLVATVIDSTIYTITINGTPITYPSGAGATADSIRDGLTNAINISGEPVTASAVLPGVLNIEPDDPAIFDLSVDSNLRQKSIMSTEGESVATLQVDVIGRDRDTDGAPPDSLFESVPVSLALQHSLESPTVQESLRSAGWSVVTIEGDRKPDQVAGSRWEDRSGFDVRLRCRWRRIEAIDWIESATVGQSIQGSTDYR